MALRSFAGSSFEYVEPTQQAKIVLLTADGRGTIEIARRTGKAKTIIWRWQERFGAAGAAGL